MKNIENVDMMKHYYHVFLNNYCFKSTEEGMIYGIDRRNGNIDFVEDDRFTKGWVNQSNDFILGMQYVSTDNASFYLIDSGGRYKKINQLIQPGFIPIDVNGNCFVFCNPQTQEVRYLDPALVDFSGEAQVIQPAAAINLEKQKQALEMWNNQVIANRDAFITQVRNGYKEFLELIPEEFKGSLREKITVLINSLYQEQEKEIRKRFQSALDSGQQEIEFVSLPFDFFSDRVGRIISVLKAYLDSSKGFIAQEKYGIQRDFYVNLFSSLFELSNDYNLTLPVINENLMEVLANGWDIPTQEQLNMAGVISELAYHIKSASHYCINAGEIMVLVEFLSRFVSQDTLKNSVVLRKQLAKILEIKPEVRDLFLNRLRSSFSGIELEVLIDYLAHPEKINSLGYAKEFAFFLTNDVEQVKEKENLAIKGEDVNLPEGGIEESQLIQLEKARPKINQDDIVMDMEYLISHLNNLPKRSDTDEAEVRRIKSMNNTIPPLDQMLSQRAWKTFAGLAEDENFKIYFIDNQGNKRGLNIDKEILSETDFIAVMPSRQKQVNSGKFRIISTKDLPSQVIDRAGLRIREIPEEYLALIPQELRRHIKELGIVIQIPLPLIRNRSAFEHENDWLPVIQKYIAVEFYKAIAYKTLTQNAPQFIFKGLADDWEINDDARYWETVIQDSQAVGLTELINNANYASIEEQALENIMFDEGFVKILLLLQVAVNRANPDERTSLFLRRLAIQQERDRIEAQGVAERMRRSGFSLGTTPELNTVPNGKEKIAQTKTIETAYKQMAHVEEEGGIKIIDPSEYSPREEEFMRLAFAIASHFGIEQVYLVSEDACFAGVFKSYLGKHTILLNRSLSIKLGREDTLSRMFDSATDVAIHELGHLLEEMMDENKWQKGYADHSINFTHQAVGRFAEAMKYAANVSLANYEISDKPHINMSSSIQEEPNNYVEPSDVSSSIKKELGGIDFGAMPIGIQSIINPQPSVYNPWNDFNSISSGLASSPLKNDSLRNGTRINTEWLQIEKMVSSGIIPSTQRIREYLLDCCQQGDFEQEEIDKVSSCIAGILRLEEERIISTDSSIQEILVLFESNKPINELQIALSKVKIN